MLHWNGLVRFLSVKESINCADLGLIVFVSFDFVVGVEVLDLGITVI